MAKIESLTPEQRAELPKIRRRWLDNVSRQVSKEDQEAAVAEFYKLNNLPTPKIIHAQSPLQACILIALMRNKDKLLEDLKVNAKWLEDSISDNWAFGDLYAFLRSSTHSNLNTKLEDFLSEIAKPQLGGLNETLGDVLYNTCADEPGEQLGQSGADELTKSGRALFSQTYPVIEALLSDALYGVTYALLDDFANTLTQVLEGKLSEFPKPEDRVHSGCNIIEDLEDELDQVCRRRFLWESPLGEFAGDLDVSLDGTSGFNRLVVNALDEVFADLDPKEGKRSSLVKELNTVIKALNHLFSSTSPALGDELARVALDLDLSLVRGLTEAVQAQITELGEALPAEEVDSVLSEAQDPIEADLRHKLTVEVSSALHHPLWESLLLSSANLIEAVKAEGNESINDFSQNKDGKDVESDIRFRDGLDHKILVIAHHLTDQLFDSYSIAHDELVSFRRDVDQSLDLGFSRQIKIALREVLSDPSQNEAEWRELLDMRGQVAEQLRRAISSELHYMHLWSAICAEVDKIASSVAKDERVKLPAECVSALTQEVRQLADKIRQQLLTDAKDEIFREIQGALLWSLCAGFAESIGKFIGNNAQAIKDVLCDSISLYYWQYDTAFYQAGKMVGVEFDEAKYNSFEQITRDLSFIFPYKNVCIVAQNPVYCGWDDEGRIHGEDRAAVSYADGFEVWALEGIRVPKELVLHPEQQTIDEINAEENEEIKRIRITRFGWHRYLEESGATVLDVAFPNGNAWMESLMRLETGEQVYHVLCTYDPSTKRPYALEVDLSCKTCEQAQRYILAPNDSIARLGVRPDSVQTYPLLRT